MKLKLLNNRLGDLLHQRNLLLVMVISLLATNLTQAAFSLFHNERVVVVPPDVRQEYWLEKNRVSPSYLEDMALFFAGLLLDVSPDSAEFKRDIILKNTVSHAYGVLKARLLEEEQQLKKQRVITSFQPNSFKTNSNELKVEVTGDLLCFVGEKKISQSRDTYQFSFVYQNNRLLIESFKLLRSDRNV